MAEEGNYDSIIDRSKVMPTEPEKAGKPKKQKKQKPKVKTWEKGRKK